MKKTERSASIARKSTRVASDTICCQLPPLPVSRKFYTAIRQRVTDSCECTPDGKEVCKSALALIDTYLAMGTADLERRPKECQLIFALLKPEIDRAIERSKAAKARAARRKRPEAEVPADRPAAERRTVVFERISDSDKPDIHAGDMLPDTISDSTPAPALSRRQRRAMQRTPKRKWARIASGKRE